MNAKAHTEESIPVLQQGSIRKFLSQIQSHWFWKTSIILGVLIGIFVPFSINWINRPEGSFYTFPFGHWGDFYQYAYFVREGMEKTMLYSLPYSEHIVPGIIFQPFYFILGMVGSLATTNQFTILFISRIVSIIVLFLAFFALARRALSSQAGQILATLCMVTATSIYTYNAATGDVLQPLTWVDTFNVFRKFTLPPHYHIAISILIIIFIFFTKQRHTLHSGLLLFTLSLIAGFLHPYNSATLLGIVTLYVIWTLLAYPRHKQNLLFSYTPVIAGSLAVILYYRYAIDQTFMAAAGQEVIIHLSRFTPPEITFGQYGSALGILSLSALTVFLSPSLFHKPLVRVLFLWAYIPFIIFGLTYFGITLVHPRRLFQIHQYIPLALLSSAGILSLIQKKKILAIGLPVCCFLLVAYAYQPFKYEFNKHIIPSGYYNAYIPEALLNNFAYLEKNTSKNSTVMASELISIIIPTFTHNHVMVGQKDSVTGYDERVSAMWSIYSKTANVETAQATLRKYHISYVLFGADVPVWTDEYSVKYPFLAKVYEHAPMSIIRVNLPD